MTFLTFLIMIETREMTPASTDMTRELFSERCKVNTRTNRFEAHRMNKKNTIGRKCHRRNAQASLSFPQRYFADRETLSRVLQSALIAGQGTHTVQEASHGHSSCAGSEDPVWTWSRWTGLARASERQVMRYNSVCDKADESLFKPSRPKL